METGITEIDDCQTTAIDQSTGIVSLTTVLAHSSGGMDRVGLAGMRHQRDLDPAPESLRAGPPLTD